MAQGHEINQGASEPTLDQVVGGIIPGPNDFLGMDIVYDAQHPEEREPRDWESDQELVRLRIQQADVDPEEYDHAGDRIYHQNGVVKGSLGPVETASSGARVGLAAGFGELPSGGVRRQRDVRGTHSPRSLSLSGEIIDKPIFSPKDLARVEGKAESLRRVRDGRGLNEQKPRVKRERVWGVESLGPDVQQQVEQLSPEQFRHLTKEDQIERMWRAYEAEGKRVRLHSVPAPRQIELNIPQLSTERDQERADRSRVLESRSRDQDPVIRKRRGEKVRTTRDNGKMRRYYKKGIGRPEEVSERDQIAHSSEGVVGKKQKPIVQVPTAGQIFDVEETMPDEATLAAHYRMLAQERYEKYAWNRDGRTIDYSDYYFARKSKAEEVPVYVLLGDPLKKPRDLYKAAGRGEVELVSLEALATQGHGDADIAEERAQIREARQTLIDQELK